MKDSLNALTSGLRWAGYWLFLLLWYPPLILASYMAPMSRLHTPARWAFRVSLRILGLKLVVRGLEHLDPKRGYLYMGNHVNIFDPFVFVSAVPQWVTAVEKRANFKLPVYGRLITRWGNIPIDRESPSAAMRTLLGLGERLKAGESICLMPEGTRTRTGEMGEFKTGPFRVAIDAKVPVVPFALVNMHHFNQTGSFRVRACTVEIVFTPPIEASEYTRATLQALSDRVREQTLAALGQADEVAGDVTPVTPAGDLATSTPPATPASDPAPPAHPEHD